MKLLIYPVGNSDIQSAELNQAKKFRSFTEKISQHVEQARITTGGLTVTLEGKSIDISLPIFYETVQTLKDIDEYLFIITNQQVQNEKDTVNVYPILKRYLKSRGVPEERIKAHEITFNPTDFDKLMEEFLRFVSDYSLTKYDEIYVILGPGTPQIQTTIELSLSELVNTIFFYTSNDSSGKTVLRKIGIKRKIESYVVRRAVKMLVERYDYVGAYTLLKGYGISQEAEKLIESIVSRQDFDFSVAKSKFDEFYACISDTPCIINEYHKELDRILEGDSKAMLEELYYQFSLRVLSKRYLEAVAMVFRFEEEILKTLVEKSLQVNIVKDSNGKFADLEKKIQEDEGLREYLEKKQIKYSTPNRVTYRAVLEYKIRDKNLDGKLKENLEESLKFFEGLEPEKSAKPAKSLADIRNSSPFAHGFEGVTENRIREVLGYGPETLVQKFCDLLGNLGLKVKSPDDRNYKYKQINDYLKKLLERV